jgi:hypothetical protein
MRLRPKKAYRGKRKITWFEIYAGEKSLEAYGDNEWLPRDTLEAIRQAQPRIERQEAVIEAIEQVAELTGASLYLGV